MTENQSPPLNAGLALIGSILMFIGWVLVIVPLFQHVKNVIVPLVLGIIGFGIVLIPSGLEFFGSRARSGEKRGVGFVVMSVLPAAVLFVVAVTAFPLTATNRILAAAAEIIGMALYCWAFWEYHHAAS